VAGDTNLGGEDFDNLLMKHFVNEFEREHKINLFTNVRAIRRIKMACERVKVSLSESNETAIYLDGIQDGLDLTSNICRERFNLLCMNLFSRTLDQVKSALTGAQLSPSDIAEVVLVGGSTRIPKIHEILKEFFGGIQLNFSVHPDEAVAHGAAIQAAILSKAFQPSFVKLKDVVPLSLGIDVETTEMSVIIPRNTKIPCTFTEEYCTQFDNQTYIDIGIYEGERPLKADNNFLGEFSLTGLKKALAGVTKQDITFQLDADGILTVSAVELGTQNSSEIKIDKKTGRLSDTEINRMLTEAEKYRELDENYKYSVAIRNKIIKFISNCTNLVLNSLYMENDVIDDVKRSCGNETVWLDANKTASVNELKERYACLKAHCEPLLKEKNNNIKRRK
jgi:heat shock 70kDa protein 1/2/6/8